MTYRVQVHRSVSNYLRDLEGLTRAGRLAMYCFMDLLRNYGDEVDAGPAIRTLHLYVDDSEAADGLLRVRHADFVSLPDEV
jgi:hypothetical protein